MVLKFAGVRRKSEFSPNHVGNDLLIINLTAEALRRLGAEVTMYDEADLTPDSIAEDFVFSMAQGPRGTEALMGVDRRGGLIINSPQSVRNCYRVNMVKLLPEHGIPFPDSRIVSTATPPVVSGNGLEREKLWIKRGDVHAVHKEDVTLAYSRDEQTTILQEFNSRGIGQAILQEHLEGDTVKFYAIRDSEFFHWYYVNGERHTPFDQNRLYELAQSSARVLGLHVFGGDVIIDAEGTIRIIDINDWPSFARVRDEASYHIGQLLLRKAQENVGQFK